MSPLYIIYVLLHFVPPIIIIGTKLCSSKISISLKISLYAFAIIYGLLIYSVLLEEFYLDFKLNQFDLNNDGVFSGSEITPEQEEAMQKVVSDTGRTFAPFTGLIFSGLFTIIFFIGFKIITYIKKLLTRPSTMTGR